MAVPFTFVHAADLHLDSPFKGLAKVPDVIRERLRESTFVAFRRLVDLVKRENVDFVVLAGDLYDAADRSLRSQLRLQRGLEELTANGIQVFVVHGNHDPESGRQAKLDWPEHVHIFRSGAVECRPAYTRSGDLAAHVYGISYPTSAVTDNLALRFKKKDGAPFHLALLHANVDGSAGHDNYAPCKLDELTASGFQYWALGHIHDRRVLHEYPHVVYPGNLQGRSIRETGAKGTYIVSVSDTGSVEMSFKDIADVLWQEIRVSIEGIEREQELKSRLMQAVEAVRQESGGRPAIVRIRMEGRGILHERLLQPTVVEEWLEELKEWLGAPEEADAWVWPESITVRTGGLSKLEDAATEEGFLGELLRQGLVACADAEQSKMLLEDALDRLRNNPKIRDWLERCSPEQRAEWIRQAMELSVSLLREEETA
jgi:DNA repair protein SbcD/Mre11